MNSLSIVASFGALVWIFQDGNLSALLGFQPLGFVETTQPVILFCVLFGLSMDYEVFLLSRMKEVYDRTGDNREAVARGLERSGRIVTSAALIVVVVAGSFVVRRHRADQGARPGRRDRRGPRRDRGPRAARARDDAAPGRLELVDPAPPRTLGRSRACRSSRARRSVQVVALMLVAALVLAACSPGGRVLGHRSRPRSRRCRQRPRRPRGAPDPQPIAFPRDDGAARSPHGVVVLHRATCRPPTAAASGSSSSIFRAERGVVPGDAGRRTWP